MWTAQRHTLDRGTLRYHIEVDSVAITYERVISEWRSDATFREWFNSVLADAPFSAFRWETPPVLDSTVSQAFEFVLVDDPRLVRTPDQQAFAEYFRQSKSASVVAFNNLGGDAILVVPCPVAQSSAYGHIAAFVRQAPKPQRDEFWKIVGESLASRLSNKAVWLSTAGAGVSWLHMRLDDRPKYYWYPPYRQSPG